ncbi:MAG: ribokinase [Synechococcaceae cyanobacterium SM2_3_2]|nr:ribokinase [Synechococcaceae cyanobacterium SM2_3_2]
MSVPSLLVIGSLNMDIVVQVPDHPQPGETVLGSDYSLYPGGKGANQAVAAARAGSCLVQMVGCLGSDAFGSQLREAIRQSGVGDDGIQSVDGSSGIALITVSRQGQNSIVVSPGANARLDPDRLDRLLSPQVLASTQLLLLQLESPLPTVIRAIQTAQTAGIPVMLNPAPFMPLKWEVLRQVRYLVLNQTETAGLLQQPIADVLTAQNAAAALYRHGIPVPIITLGELGVVWASAEGIDHLPALGVEVVDTTAAGDCFCGALASALVSGASLRESICYGAAGAALAVTRVGAQPSLPWQPEIKAFLGTHSGGG